MLLALLVLPSPALAGPYDALLVGNSYTARNRMGAQLEADSVAGVPAWSDAAVETSTGGGWTWTDHLQNAESGAVVWTVPRDVLVLQEQSQTPGLDPASTTWLASLDAVLGLADHAPDAHLVLLMTWGRRDGDPANPSIYPDFVAMNDRLEDGYLAYRDALVADGHVVAVAPVGRAFRAVYDASAAAGDPLQPGSRFVQLYEGDGSHPSPYGSILLEAVLYATLSGRDPVGLPPVAELDAADVDELRGVAADVVLTDPHGDLEYPWATSLAEHVGPVTSAGARPVLASDDDLSLPHLEIGGDDGGLPGAGEVRVRAGRLAVDGGLVDLGGHLRLDPGGTLALPATERALDVVGSASLEGTLAVDGCPPGETLLVAGDGLAAPLLDAPCADGVLESRSEGLVLVVAGPDTTGSDPTEPDPAEAGPTSGGDVRGCGCGVAARLGGWLPALTRRRPRSGSTAS